MLFSIALLAPVASAQQAIGSVSTADAAVVNSGAGIVRADAGRATMLGSSTVTARDRTAAVSLARGGEVRVCRSTALHLTAAADDSLQLALDRGAFEMHGRAHAGDVLVTPDLRLTLADAGPLDLQVRVVMNGDTCVDNRGRGAPTLRITDAFGEAQYELKPGQHVMFEHGNLRQVVDRETTPCGCPPDEPAGMSLADAGLSGGGKHPFPAGVSEGLEEPAAPAPQAAGTTHVQVATSLGYDPTAPQAVPETLVEPMPEKRPKGNAFGAIGRFFKRLFVR